VLSKEKFQNMRLIIILAVLQIIVAIVAGQTPSKKAPAFPTGFYTTVSQCQVTGPSSDSCDYYMVQLYYDYVGQRAKVNYVYKVNQIDQTEGQLLFRWDLETPKAFNIQYGDEYRFAEKDDDDDDSDGCTCMSHVLSGQPMPILKVHEDSVYAGLKEIDDEPVDTYFYNKTYYSLEYFVSVQEEESDPVLPISSIQLGGIYGDFYCNFTNTKVKQPKEREFTIPDCCMQAEQMDFRHNHAKVFEAGNLRAPAPIRLALGCLTPPRGNRANLNNFRLN